ncbi:MAG: hypothetical protein HY054_00665 [Proteobacteria bacterium]|nr:hypothetical protein [Pseudomonadota bacterium]
MKSFLRGAAVALVASIVIASGAYALPDPSMSFDENSPQTLLAATGQLQQVRGVGSTYYFRPVDLESGRFLGPPIPVRFAFANWRQGDELREVGRARDKERVLFAVKTFEPGAYALIGQDEQSNGTAHEFASVCYAEHAPVYLLSAGQIAIVDAYRGSLMSYNANVPRQVQQDRIISDFERLRADYPNIHGAAVRVEPSAIIQWPMGAPGFVERLTSDLSTRCRQTDTFTVVAQDSDVH